VKQGRRAWIAFGVIKDVRCQPLVHGANRGPVIELSLHPPEGARDPRPRRAPRGVAAATGGPTAGDCSPSCQGGRVAFGARRRDRRLAVPPGPGGGFLTSTPQLGGKPSARRLGAVRKMSRPARSRCSPGAPQADFLEGLGDLAKPNTYSLSITYMVPRGGIEPSTP